MAWVVPWRVFVVEPARSWLHELRVSDRATLRQISTAIDILAEEGPALGRPLVDTITGSRLANLKELRPGSAGTSEIRLLFIFECATRRCQYRMVVGDPRRRVVVAA